jgi:hypothetical protein
MDYFENIYLNKLENLEETDKFLETYDHSKLNLEYTNHLNKSITSNEIEAGIINPPSLPKKCRIDGFTAEFYQAFKEELIPTVLKLFLEIERKGTLPHLFYEASITLIPKPDKDTAKKELQANFLNEFRCKNPQ